jgi:hypothetical protein
MRHAYRAKLAGAFRGASIIVPIVANWLRAYSRMLAICRTIAWRSASIT